MKLFFDTEFTGLDQEHPKLISLAVVLDNTHFYYAELTDCYTENDCSEWVIQNVLPLLLNKKVYQRSLQQVRNELKQWIENLNKPCDIYSDCPMADVPFLWLLWPKRTDWPSNLNQNVQACYTPPPFSDLIQHNSLDDAKAMFRFDRQMNL